jgi:phenylacetic acid degradation operon negative regulatory protein
VVTVWGDAIAPHGGAIWLGSLIRLLAPLGLNERLVRTSVYRLTREGWLTARQDGRRSLYRLSVTGMQRFEHAYRRIYAPPAMEWDGTWDIVLAPTTALTAAQRRAVKRELAWEGFGLIAAGVFARPAREHAAGDLSQILAGLGVGRQVVALEGRDTPGASNGTLRARAKHCWDLSSIANEYRTFLARFGSVVACFRDARAVDPEQAFVVRSLLIHAFRRVTLHDPQLPRELAPPRWPAPRAYALCRDFYRLTQRAAEEHLASTVEPADGPLAPAAPYFYERFGGL